MGHEKLNVEMQRTYSKLLRVVKIPKSGGVRCVVGGAPLPARYYIHLFIHSLHSQVVELDHLYRERVHNYQLHTYMYGQIIPPPAGISSASLGGETLSDLVLSPSSTVINFDDLSIFRIGAGERFPAPVYLILIYRAQKRWPPRPRSPSAPRARSPKRRPCR